MSKFDDLKPRISKYGGNPHQLDPSEVEQLRSEYPDLPQDYFAFLEAIGCGCMGSFHLYSGPMRASKLPREAARLGCVLPPDHVLLVGDDGLGNFFGFATKDRYRLVEVDSDGEILPSEEKSFLDLVRYYLD